MTPATRATRSLIAAIASMSIVDLTHPLERGMPVYPTHPQFFAMPWQTGDIATMNQLLIGEHAGTHFDSPAHFYPDAADPRYLSVADVPLATTIGAAVKLDFRGVTANAEVGPDDIRSWEREHRRLASGEAAVFDFGWASKWAPLPEGREFLAAWPGLTRAAAQYLVERGVRAACTDCLGIDGSATTDLGVHCVLLENHVAIVESLRALDELPQEFLLITLPLKIAGGTGSPIRAVALFGREGGEA